MLVMKSVYQYDHTNYSLKKNPHSNFSYILHCIMERLQHTPFLLPALSVSQLPIICQNSDGLSPVWTRMCDLTFPCLEKRFAHTSQIKWFICCVDSHVPVRSFLMFKSIPTNITTEWFLSCLDFNV